MSGTLQIWGDKELGSVRFRDKNETLHSKKCKVSDIDLIDKFDRKTSSRLRKEISDEINRVENRK